MKKRTLLYCLAIPVIILLASCGKNFKYSSYTSPIILNPSKGQDSIPLGLSIIKTGEATPQEGFVFENGSFFKKNTISHIAVLISHPKGNLLFDTGLGNHIDDQFHEDMPWYGKVMFKYTKLNSASEVLKESNIPLNHIILSHLHWDHASGISDFSGTPVWTTKEEIDHAFSEKAASGAFLPSQYKNPIEWRHITFSKKNYEIFSESCDFYNDGSLILVKIPGHTEGSVGLFVNLKSGKRYFFIGDLVWSMKALEKNSEKFFIPRNLVDYNREEVREMIFKIHSLSNSNKAIYIVPAHDDDAQKSVAHFPEVEY
jgi:glyoxylase-like metal-dependent hydrolase (beta-lactamase superfamily II)